MSATKQIIKLVYTTIGKEGILMKKQNGITLVALSITIIVLLILAGVSIVTLTGDNRNYHKNYGCKTEEIIGGQNL